MKKSAILCAALALALAISIGAQFVSKAWLKTTFGAADSVTMTVDDKDFEFPLVWRTAVMYKTSDSSYVLLSRGDFSDVENFYAISKKYETTSPDGRGDIIAVTADGKTYLIEKLADDLDYVKYSVEAVR